MRRLLEFTRESVLAAGGSFVGAGATIYEAVLSDGRRERFTTDRAHAKDADDLSLLGLEHPLVRLLLSRGRELPAHQRALRGRLGDGVGTGAVLTVWRVEVHGTANRFTQAVVTIALTPGGDRHPQMESLVARLRELELAGGAQRSAETRAAWLRTRLPQMIRRELQHRGLLEDDASVASQLLAWVELD